MKKILVIGIIFLFIFLSITPSSAVDNVKKPVKPISKGNILYVGGMGLGNFSKIQYAIDNASDGDTVFVYDDSSPYYENVVVHISINLIGEDRDTTVIDGGKRGDTVTINSDGTTVNGFTIRRDGWYDDGIKINANQSNIFGNIFENNGAGIYSFRTNGHVVQNNIFYDNHEGMRLIHAEKFHIENNDFDANYMYGITLFYGSNNIVSYNTITANTNIAIQQSYIGINVGESSDNVISNNNIISILDTCYAGIELSESTNNVIQDNTFVKNGLVRFLSYQNTVTGNTINGKPLVYLEGETNKVVHNAGQVILIDCEDITVQNSEISHARSGIELENSKNCDISGNSMFYCWWGVFLKSSPNNIVNNNRINETRYGIHIDNSRNTVVSGNTVENNMYRGITIDSSFVTIKENIIRNNSYGIWITSGIKNTLMSNEITNNYRGIYLIRAFSNSFKKNNIYNNELDDAYFVNSFLNKWFRNYWKDIIPLHRIKGEIYIERGWHFGSPPPIIIPIPNFDILPAKEPYDIPIAG